MSLPIQTPRLCLRRFQDADLEPFLAYRNDPEVARYQGWSVPYGRERALAFLTEMKDKRLAPGEWLQLAFELRATGETIGDVAIHLMKDDSRQAYIGYSLARACWGKGYATEAVRAALGWLFGELNLHRVAAECDERNTASQRLLERVGFRREAHVVEAVLFKGEYSSEYHYAILQREWK